MKGSVCTYNYFWLLHLLERILLLLLPRVVSSLLLLRLLLQILLPRGKLVGVRVIGVVVGRIDLGLSLLQI